MIRQGADEPLWEYIAQFNKEARAADKLEAGVVLMLAKEGVKEGSPFFLSFSKALLNMMKEFFKKGKKIYKLWKYFGGKETKYGRKWRFVEK